MLNNKIKECSVWLIGLWSILLLSACSSNNADEVDKLNDMAYAYRYRSLDSTTVYARRALSASDAYDAGKAEALNNLAFVSIAKMDYQRAAQQLDSAINITDNQVELMVAEIQYMRLCQRQSHNKLFYDHHEKAKKYLERIEEEKTLLNQHQLKRMVYAQSEFYINTSIYYYYVGLVEPSVEMMEVIEPDGDILKDTTQYLNYLYNMGAGGIIGKGVSAEDIPVVEFGYLQQCYLLARQKDYIYWQAQAMQAMSEHLLAPLSRKSIANTYQPFLDYINTDAIADHLLAGNLAQRSLELFAQYGDVYQTAGSYRTLASCYWEIEDFPSALLCLNSALETDTVINRAPDLVASIREQLCLVYSAMNDKRNSDINRNYYLDLQEQTRQDKMLEARADQLLRSSRVLNAMIVAVLFMIAVVLFVLVYFARKRKRQGSAVDIDNLLAPLKAWNEENDKKLTALDDRLEEIKEQTVMVRLDEEKNKHRNLEQRAKLALVNSITPFIDRIINEVNRLKTSNDKPEVKQERYDYIVELTDVINDYNAVLTKWIQMQQGRVSLKIESFGLQELFDIVAKGRMTFSMNGIELDVEATQAVVKADKVLTLFMVNTLADNARKFTPDGGKVVVKAQELDECVEISVEDTGCGMDDSQCSRVFDNKPIADDGTTARKSHGFGLLNCKGIIENYKKISRIFSVCDIFVESEKGKGSRFTFRLPKGVARSVLALAAMLIGGNNAGFANDICLQRASGYADSAYYSNLNATYERTLVFADSCMKYLNMSAKPLQRNVPLAKMTLAGNGNDATPPEVAWLQYGVHTDYKIIMDIRNEVAVAALALHDWNLYNYNNKVYTRLFHEYFADGSLPHYVRTMQKSENNKWVAIVILVLLLISIPPIYYLVYYRHVLYYRICVERIKAINDVIIGNGSDNEKLSHVEEFKSRVGKLGIPALDEVVSEIHSSLKLSADTSGRKADLIEEAADTLRMAERENNMLYISNSVLDNCLSALKHETMYFPTRIKQFVEAKEDSMATVDELATYYKQLYTMLSAQAMRQTERPFRIDKEALGYLFDILKKLNGGTKPEQTIEEKDSTYVKVACKMPNLRLTEQQAQQLFTPLTVDVNCLVCRQIIRELGEMTNLRACGISCTADNTIEIIIIMPKVIWNNLMS